MEDELADLAQVHEESGLIVELVLEVLSQPLPVPGHYVEVDRGQGEVFRRALIRAHFPHDTILVRLAANTLRRTIHRTLITVEIIDWAD